MKTNGTDIAVLAVGVLAMGSAAVLIREADAPALVIAFYRLTLASLPLLAFTALSRSPLVPGGGRARWLMLIAGVCLALHFAFWIASLERTSVMASVVLVATQPLFVAAMSGPLLRERTSAGLWAGIALAVAGAAVMVSGDLGAAGTLTGDLFALLGAMFAAVYVICGRVLRSSGVDWLPYTAGVYSIAAIALAVGVAASGGALGGYSTQTYAMFGLLALVPQLVGHTAMNRSLGYLPATAVSLAIVAEPVVSTALAAIFLDETPSVVRVFGAALLLAGVYCGLRLGTRRSRDAAASGGEPAPVASNP